MAGGQSVFYLSLMGIQLAQEVFIENLLWLGAEVTNKV